MSATYSGGCLCGNVRYEATINDQTAAGHCQCRDCQQSTGSAMSTFCMVAEDDFTLTRGQLKQYSANGASGRKVTRNFCGDCGSPIVSTGDAMPGLVLIKAGSFDDSDWVKPAMLF